MISKVSHKIQRNAVGVHSVIFLGKNFGKIGIPKANDRQ